LVQIDRQINAIDAELKASLTREPDLAAHFDVLVSIPGIGELMRSEGRKNVPTAPLSRALAGSRGTVLVVNLPGSPRGAVESLDAMVELVPHIADLLAGKTEHS